MSVAWVTALALGLTPYAGAGVTTEVRAGVAPVIIGQPPTESAAAIVNPNVTVGERDPTTLLRLTYSPRLLWRQPNPAASDRVLVLHQGELSLDEHLARTVRWRTVISGYAGEVDYMALRTIVGTSQSALPLRSELAAISGTTGVAVDTSADWTHSVQARASHLQPLHQTFALPPPPPPGPNGLPVTAAAPIVLPTNTNVGLLYTAAHKLTRIDTVAADADAAYWKFSPGLELLAFTPQARWQRSLAPHETLQLAAGVTVSDRLRSDSATSASKWSAVPIGLADLVSRLVSSRDLKLDGRTGVAVTYWVDPVLGQASARGIAHVGVAADLPHDVTASIDASVATNISRRPQPGFPDETMFYLAAPVRWRATDELALEVGVRWLERGPHLRAPNWHFRDQRELWAYASVTVAFTTWNERHAPGGPEAAAAR